MALNFKTLLTRTMTAAVFVAVLLFCINLHYLTFSVLFGVVSLWGLYEFYKISELLGARPFKIPAYIAAALLYISVYSKEAGFHYYDLLFNSGVCFVFFIFLNALFSKNEKPLRDIGYTVIGIFYCVIPFIILNKLACPISHNNISSSSFIYCYTQHYTRGIILGMIFLIWASDSFAYLVGSLIGKRKLYERISPGKTWEGTIGGGVLTMASSYIIAGWFPEIQFVNWLVISILVVVFGTLGDLFESMLKRQAGIKDSGKIMPGHGGILDRFDSLIFVTPFVYLYLSWVLG